MEDSSEDAVDACGAAGMADLTADEGLTLYVSSETGSDEAGGSLDAPFATIGAALEHVPDGGATVAIAAGLYLENLTLDDALYGTALRGTCADKVVIDGSEGRSDEMATLDLYSENGASFGLYDLTVTGGYRGVRARGVELDAENLQVVENYRIGFSLDVSTGGVPTFATVRHLDVLDTQPTEAEGQFGSGVGVVGGSYLELTHANIEGNHRIGIGVTGEPIGAEWSAQLTDVVIADTTPAPDDMFWTYGLLVGEQARVKVEDTTVSNSVFYGVFVASAGTEFEADNLEVSGTYEQEDTIDLSQAYTGAGISIVQGASVTLTDGRIVNNAAMGIGVTGSSHVELERMDISGSYPAAAQLGYGLLSQESESTISDSTFDGNTSVGVALSLSSIGTITGSVVQNTRVAEVDGDVGVGLYIANGSMMDITQVDVDNNAGAGIILDNGASATVTDVTVTNTIAGQWSDTRAGYGVMVNASQLSALNLDISNSVRAGPLVQHNPTIEGDYELAHAMVDGLKIADTTVDASEGQSGAGFGCSYAICEVSNAEISGSEWAGILVEGADTVFEGTNLTITDAQPEAYPHSEEEDGFGLFVDLGMGISVAKGASAVFRDVEVYDSILMGVSILDADVALENVSIIDTADEEITSAVGLIVGGTSQVTASGVTIEGGELVGMMIGLD